MSEKTEKKRLAILKVLNEESKPLSSHKISERLESTGLDMSERTVRLHLQAMDRLGLTENFGRQGRRITGKGERELHSARIFEKVGYLAAKIDQMTYRMDFDLATKTGKVVVNVSIMDKRQMEEGIHLLNRVFESGYTMGWLMALFGPGERIGDMSIPEGKIGVGTVCSITINGVLLHQGIPTISRFGGILELRNRRPARFVELIHYEGTTLDPLEVFIRSGMTDYWNATETGNGLVGAGFREVPGDSRQQVNDIAVELEKAGLGGVCLIGWPGRPLLEIPVSEGRLGFIVMGGLNPVAILVERGMLIRETGALAGFVDYQRLFHYRKLAERIATID